MIAIIKSFGIPVMNGGKRVDDKEYIVATIIIVVSKIVMVNYIRFIRIMMYYCILLGAKYFTFLYYNSF